MINIKTGGKPYEGNTVLLVFHMMVQKIIALDVLMKVLTERTDKPSVANIIKQAVAMHHGLTVFHPYGEGIKRVG